ncbi:MAG: ferredoxin--NADP reductase [Zoogloea sp.]|uniref:ferredoxin--NADP reductase n=1 Tax=Zoogloea sp. TaxID=49181 RepID=UPI0026072837|nr:ferredoxin--NADP reductase [Zoogloea sp.]MDD2991221.1 ferredoxin--NADP reductase [Zoogloea sp.]
MTANRYHRLTVQAVTEETPDARSITLAVPEGLADSFRYRPGQFLTLRLAVDGRHLPRCYSMSSTPGLDEALRVTVKRVAGGRGSGWLCSKLRPGDSLEVMAPAGIFTPAGLEGDFILAAGGSGITPVFSILRAVLARGCGRIRLIYANRDEGSVIFRDALKALAAEHPSRLQVIHWLDSVQGTPTVAQLAEFGRGFEGAQAFICGPGPFMDAMATALAGAGLDPERVHVERFVSLPDEEDAQPAVAADAPPPQVDTAEVSLLLDGTEHHFSCGGSETLLDAAERQGISLPHSCRVGMCASCMCQVEEGEVVLHHNDALDARDLARRWTLACQATPATPRLRVKFPG